MIGRFFVARYFCYIYNMRKQLFLLFACLCCSPFVHAQLTITDSITVPQIVSLLQGSGITITSLTVHCKPCAIGEFSGVSEMPITHGLVLSTGYVDSIANGNYATHTGTAFGTTGADPDLMTIEPSATHDLCAIEFDCIPTGDSLLFNFSFGSEEYPEFVNATFNDAFGIFASGPGITGNHNVARIPSGTAVSVNNVNAGTNSAYYYNNESPRGQYICFDGFTLNLHAFTTVIPGSTYHFKIAIADAGDSFYDSGVFLEAFSFRSIAASPLSVKEDKLHRLNVYPNPANGIFTLYDPDNLYKDAELRVVNSLGQIVFSERINLPENKIDLTGQPEGIYYLLVNTGNAMYKMSLIRK